MKTGKNLSHAGVALVALLAAVSLVLPVAAMSMGDGKININAATSGELTALPGIGQAKADAIVAYREKNGPFASAEDLAKVRGIGAGLLEKIRELVTTR